MADQTITAPATGQAPLSHEQLREIYKLMIWTRSLDERGMNLQRQGRIGFYIGALGMEASHIGTAYALEANDWVFPSYRNAGVLLLRRVPLKRLFDQMMGNADDPTLGRQMPCHYADAGAKFVSISSPIGTQIAQAAGAARAAQVRGDKSVVMTTFGDGGTSSNDFHTGMNFAAVWKAPCVFVCENNQWAISCPLDKQTASESIAIKAEAYGMPGVQVDGNDAEAVYAAARAAVDRARRGEGPTLIETLTFRLGPHSSSDDPKRYRDPALVEEWKAKDPIDRLRARLTALGAWSQAFEDECWNGAKEAIAEAVAASEKVGPPRLRTLFEGVYEDVPTHLQAQWQQLQDEYARWGAAENHGGAFPL